MADFVPPEIGILHPQRVISTKIANIYYYSEISIFGFPLAFFFLGMTTADDRYDAEIGDTAYCGNEECSTTDETYDIELRISPCCFLSFIFLSFPSD